jgi:hypothetical protein
MLGVGAGGTSVTTGFDFSPGAQVPRTDVPSQLGVTNALATGAYRDGPADDLTALRPDVEQKHRPRRGIFAPNFGEAFSRAVLARTLGSGRAPLVPSFGTDPRIVVEHCLEAEQLRRDRDRRLTAVTAVAGLLFLPGTLLWLLAFQLRALVSRGERGAARENFYGGLAFLIIAVLAAYLAYSPPASGFWGFYLRIVLLVPIAGWYWARRICIRSTDELRGRWSALLEGGGAVVGPTVPSAVPRGPEDTKREQLRTQLAGLLSEQETNVLHYAGRKGVLGLGARWGVWQLAEELRPAEGQSEFHPFRAWDVVRRIEDRLKTLNRGAVTDAGIPHPLTHHWVVLPVDEGADSIGRPAGPEMDGPRMRPFNIEQTCNAQRFGLGPRHYLSVQFVLWEGQLVVTLMITVTLLHNTLRLEVTGHALGPVDKQFMGKPKPRTETVAKTGKFWEQRTRQLPLLTNDEVVRLTVRAPFTWSPGLLDWLGGRVTLPEPFGLRYAWVSRPWTHRFMADDAIRVATPVLRAVHSAAIEYLAEQGVDLTRFDARSLMLSNEVQSAKPGRADVYDAD